LLKIDDRLSLPKFDLDKIEYSVYFTKDISLAFMGEGFSAIPKQRI